MMTISDAATRPGLDALGEQRLKALGGPVVAEEVQAGPPGETAEDGAAHVAAADAADAFVVKRCGCIHVFSFRADSL